MATNAVLAALTAQNTDNGVSVLTEHARGWTSECGDIHWIVNLATGYTVLRVQAVTVYWRGYWSMHHIGSVTPYALAELSRLMNVVSDAVKGVSDAI